jgi:hypothetical protein
MHVFKIHVLEHRKTGLLMALCDELPGFTVHADTDEALEAKLAPAFKQYMRAAGRHVESVQVTREAHSEYWPPTFLAKAAMEARAA